MADVGQETLEGVAKSGPRRLGLAISSLASGQYGVVSHAQLVALGLSASAIRARVARGSLVRLHRGVYAVGHTALRVEAHYLAAVLASGTGAALSHASAAAHLGIRPSSAGLIDVTVGRSGRRAQRGVRLHRSRTLLARDVVLIGLIATTTCARTLIDLAEMLHLEALAKAFDQAEILRLLDLRGLEDVIARNPGRHGLERLRIVMRSLDPHSKRTRLDFERGFLRLCREAGLPRPEVNPDLILEGRHVQPDFLWKAQRLALETDGFETHRTRLAFERDRSKDALLLRHGYRTIRVTWRQLSERPAEVVATVRAGLAQALAGEPA